jgi:hypothetical protein
MKTYEIHAEAIFHFRLSAESKEQAMQLARERLRIYEILRADNRVNSIFHNPLVSIRFDEDVVGLTVVES